jgi:putative transposase
MELRSGELVLWNGGVYKFEGLKGDRARIRDANCSDLREVPVAELRGLASLPIVELDRRAERLRSTDESEWNSAQRRETVIREAMQGEGPASALVDAAAKSLGVSGRTVRRLIARYTASAQTTSLLAHAPGPNKTHRRLGAQRERLIDTAIEKRYLVRPRTPMEEVYKEVVRRCRGENLVPPARNSVLRRIRALDARLVARRRLGAKFAESIALSTPGMLEATDALELVQIDHTLADIMIVDSEHRRSIGRPWLSLAVDVATRSVLGCHLGVEAPSALAVALCIEHSVLPKIRTATSSTADTSWDMFGIPRRLLVDNGPEFTARPSHAVVPNAESSWRTGPLPDRDSAHISRDSSVP